MLAVAAVGVVVAGCGGGGSLAVGDVSDTSKPVTKAQATAYAHAVNLRAEDVPGMTMSTSETEGESERSSTEELNRCAGASGREHQLVDIKSAEFTRGEGLQREVIGSGVSVMSSATFATQELEVLRSKRGLACIEQFAKQQLAQEGAGSFQVDQITTSPLEGPIEGVDESFGLRVAMTLAVPSTGVQTPFYLDVLGFASGPAEVALYAVGVSTPVASATEHQLLLLLHRRATATKL